MPQLLISRAGRFLKALAFGQIDVLTIGRAPTNDIVLSDPGRKVSRLHAAIVRAHPAEEQYFLRDLGSLISTRVGGAAVHQRVLNHGDVVRIGEYELAWSAWGEAEGLTETPVAAGGRRLLDEALRILQAGSRLSKVFEGLIGPVLGATRSVQGFAGLFLPERGLAYRMVGARDGIRINDAAVLERLRAGQTVQESNLLLIPVPGREGIAGFLCVARGYGAPPFTREDRDLLIMLVTLAAAHVHKRSPEDRSAPAEILDWPATIIGKTEAIHQAIGQIRAAAATDAPVVLAGEAGAGKSLAARAIHLASGRRAGPFVAIDLAALPAARVEAELPGAVEQARGGTLFLDEIGLLGPGAEAWLPGAIQAAGIRLVAATSRDVAAELDRRIAVVRIGIPPLRERREDIPLLAFYFLDKYARAYGSKTRSISRRALAALSGYTWPANVAELEGYLAAAVSGRRAMLFSWDFPPCLQAAGPAAAELEQKEHLLEVLESTGGNISRTAEMLDWSRSTVITRMNRFGIPRPE